ncbi:MAG: DUF1552 domain-containing protein [Polyangiaceae bacterium]|nr:DUF1552 domain-containing protein [Polyangiaceae bacterium]
MTNYSRRSVSFSRRSFVQKMGFGAGAALLAPLAKNILKEANGQAVGRQVAMFYFACGGLNPYWVFTPPEFAEDLTGVDPQLPAPIQGALVDSAAFTLPPAFAPLQAYRSQLLLVDGLKNHPRKGAPANYGCSHMALSCVPGTDVDHTMPGNLTFDQHVAGTLSANAPRKSVLIGISSHTDLAMRSELFAAGSDQKIGAYQSPALLFEDLFGSQLPAKPTSRFIFDAMRADIHQLESQFAAPERDKLSKYLASMETYEKALQPIVDFFCGPGQRPTLTQTGDPEAVFDALHALASLALVCGITNVIGVDIGSGNPHDNAPGLRGVTGSATSLADLGRADPSIQAPAMRNLYAWLSGKIASNLDEFAKLPGAVSALAMLTSDNGEAYNSQHRRWPVLLAGSAGSLKLDGRFVRYPDADNRPLVDLYSTLGAALSVPPAAFGTHPDGLGPNVPAQGPLSQLL